MRYFLFYSRSNPKITYLATEDDEGNVSCPCPGFIRHTKCWHVKEILAGRDAIRRMTASEKAVILEALQVLDGTRAIFRARELYPSMTYKEAKELVTLTQALFDAEGAGWL